MENPKYELIIEAQDMVGQLYGLLGTATATILIDDKNDHSPEFTKKEFQATVEEGAVGVIVNLTVEDKDDPTTGAWRAAYTIINGNPGQSFEIHTNPQNNEGMLSVVKPLDYEISAFHTLLIKVENEDPLVPDVSYGPSSTATVHITVLDVNEGPVFYPDPMMVTRQENISVGSVLLTVNATDPDSLQHQTIRYSVYKDPAGWLNINPINGTVDTTAVLDRESPFVHNSVYTALFLAIDSDTHALVSLLQNLNKANYQLPIMVTDSGKPPMTNVTDLRVQVCSCKNSKVDCNAAGALHFSLTSVLLISLFSLAFVFKAIVSGALAEKVRNGRCRCALSLTSPLDDMSSRIDDLEKNIADLMTQAGVEELEGENKIPATQKS
ncbi:Cadherin-13 [Myotis brandtii]|uniref:Cadherin-13 n=1 Tax=Myotis brandtii TaxID=109478 RepID=S7MPY4_MYOBR|nr:Cadherin-13 [Myotis brandtii]